MKLCAVLFLVVAVVALGEASIPDDDECKPGERFYADGMLCTCLESGSKYDAICEYGKQPLKRDAARSVVIPSDSPICVPGKIFIDSMFRWCFCLGGRPICLPSFLPPPPMPPALPSASKRMDGEACTPGDSFLIDEYVCKCPPNGILLLPEDCYDMSGFTDCIPGEIFHRGPEVCICPETGDLNDAECNFTPSKRSSRKGSTRGEAPPSGSDCISG